MPGAAYSVPSPIQITYFRKGLTFSGAIAADIIPIPLGWVASVRYLSFQVTTLFAGTIPVGLIQVGDGITVNKYAQLQIGTTAVPGAVGFSYWTIGPPPAAGVSTTVNATAGGLGASNSGLTGRNPANAPSSGVSGPFLFSGGSAFGALSLTATTGLTGLNITYTIPTGSAAGVGDMIMVYELSDVG